jgi:hypothetical protein
LFYSPFPFPSFECFFFGFHHQLIWFGGQLWHQVVLAPCWSQLRGTLHLSVVLAIVEYSRWIFYAFCLYWKYKQNKYMNHILDNLCSFRLREIHPECKLDTHLMEEYEENVSLEMKLVIVIYSFSLMSIWEC